MDNGFLPICSEPKLTERNRQTVEKEAGRDSGPFRYQRFVCALWGDRQTDRQTDRDRDRETGRERWGRAERGGGSERANKRETDRQSDKIILYYTRGERERGRAFPFCLCFYFSSSSSPPAALTLPAPPHSALSFCFSLSSALSRDGVEDMEGSNKPPVP